MVQIVFFQYSLRLEDLKPSTLHVSLVKSGFEKNYGPTLKKLASHPVLNAYVAEKHASCVESVRLISWQLQI